MIGPGREARPAPMREMARIGSRQNPPWIDVVQRDGPDRGPSTQPGEPGHVPVFAKPLPVGWKEP